MSTLVRVVVAALYNAKALLCYVLELYDDSIGMERSQGY